ncbi:hypothetical protein ES702_00729 [subsurface metagenome]
MSRRERIEIIKEILELCKTPVLKTHIVYKCNLNFKIVKKYLNWCFERGWLMCEKVNRNILYTTTIVGSDYLNLLTNDVLEPLQF